MKVATMVLLTLGILLTLAGLVPCLGWLNWFGVPICSATAIMGIIGLATDKDPVTGVNESQALYVCALVFGLVLGVVGAIRCSAGAGLL